jgi:hypothetical protein
MCRCWTLIDVEHPINIKCQCYIDLYLVNFSGMLQRGVPIGWRRWRNILTLHPLLQLERYFYSIDTMLASDILYICLYYSPVMFLLLNTQFVYQILFREQYKQYTKNCTIHKFSPTFICIYWWMHMYNGWDYYLLYDLKLIFKMLALEKPNPDFCMS